MKCWTALRAPTGKRLAPMLGVLVPLLRGDDELDLTDAEAALLVLMIPATYCKCFRRPKRSRHGG